MSIDIGVMASAGVRNTIAAYAHALDDGRTDDVVATFAADGTSDIAGVGTFSGHEQLRGAYANLVPTAPQRHLVANTVVTAVSDSRATASSDFVYVLRGDEGWSVIVAGHYDDALSLHGDRWVFDRRETTYAM